MSKQLISTATQRSGGKALSLAIFMSGAALASTNALAFQAYQDSVNAACQPPKTQAVCGTCHIDPKGGGPLTTLGANYKSDGAMSSTANNNLCTALNPTTTTTTAKPTTTTTTAAPTTTTTTAKPTTTTTTAAPTTTTTTAKPTTTTTTAAPTTTTTTAKPTTTTTAAPTTTTTGSTTTTTLNTSCNRRNRPPILDVEPGDEVTAQVDHEVKFTASASDRDGSVESLTAKVGKRGTPLTAGNPGFSEGVFNWTPAPTDEGKELLVTITAKDNCGKSTSETVDIHVQEQEEQESKHAGSSRSSKTQTNTAPFVSVADTITAPAGEVTTVPVTALDPEGDKVALSAKKKRGVSLVKKGVDTETGATKAVIKIKPAKEQAGTSFAIALKAKDKAHHAKQVTKNVTVVVPAQ